MAARAYHHDSLEEAQETTMNEANTLADVIGHDPDAAPAFPRDPAAPAPVAIDEALVLGFCGFLTADIPELHGVHPQQIAASWARFRARVAEGFDGLQFEQHENGDGR